jgi:hypothetical protein
MEPVEASVTGTLRIIAVLVVLWLVLRMIRGRMSGGAAARKPNWANPMQRPKGEVRIEPVAPDAKRDKENGPAKANITDADFEEVK